jgi:hypothetical protein
MNHISASSDDLSANFQADRRMAFAAMLATMILIGPTHATSNSEVRLKEVIESVAPTGWSVVEVNRDALPVGHYWGERFTGERGYEMVLQGPMPVYFAWSDRAGGTHKDPLAREALRLYIMPAAYQQDSFKPKGPVPARLLWEGQSAKIYAMPSSKVLNPSGFNELLKQTQSTDWPDSPGRTGKLSWTSWERDVKAAVRKAYD